MLSCTERQRNVQIIITDVHSHCSAHLFFCSMTLPLPLPSWFRKLPTVWVGARSTRTTQGYARVYRATRQPRALEKATMQAQKNGEKLTRLCGNCFKDTQIIWSKSKSKHRTTHIGKVIFWIRFSLVVTCNQNSKCSTGGLGIFFCILLSFINWSCLQKLYILFYIEKRLYIVNYRGFSYLQKLMIYN